MKASWLASHGVLTSVSLILLFQKLKTPLLCQKLQFVIIKPLEVNFYYYLCCISGLAFE
jgi:hypothetical protein